MTPFTEAQQSRLSTFYDQYNTVIKPLMSAIEARYESLPTPIHNELRAFNDHIARCYRANMTPDSINKELNKAEGHIKRTILDCFKFLNVKLSDYVKNFEREVERVDISTISNGEFYITYKKLKQAAIADVR